MKTTQEDSDGKRKSNIILLCIKLLCAQGVCLE